MRNQSGYQMMNELEEIINALEKVVPFSYLEKKETGFYTKI